MFGNSSSSPHVPGLSGSGAQSHAYTQYPPLSYKISGSKGLFYDDANKLLLLTSSDKVFSWKVFPFGPSISPTSDSIGEGPILSIRYSLDLKVFAVQRSTHEVEFYNRETGETFSHGCNSESESILGFFWTDFPSCDIVFVKTSGLKFFSCISESKTLCLVETKKVNINWYVYTHESRMILLASGMQCKNFSGFQLSSVGITRLPKFEVKIAKSDANCMPVLDANDVHVVTVYGRIYCLVVDRIAMQLNLYRFYRDAVVQQGCLPIYSTKIAVSVVDNVLLVHQMDSMVVILYDIFVDSRAPISAPLPLLVRGSPKIGTSLSRSSARCTEASPSRDTGDHEASIYRAGWTFLVPDLIYDAADGTLWKIHLDLEAISASCSEVKSMLEFLQRRKLEANKAKRLCLAILRTTILERRPFSSIAKAIDIIVTTYSHSLKIENCLKSIKVDKISPSGNPNAVSDETASEIDKTREVVQNNFSGGVDTDPLSGSVILDASNSEYSLTFGPLKPSSGDPCLVDNVFEESSFGPAQSEIKPYSAVPSNNTLRDDIVEREDFQVTSAAISPEELYSVFASVENEMAGDTSYMVAIMVEFIRRFNLEKIKLHPNVFVLTAQMLARNHRFAELGLFVINKIFEPSKEVALELLESGCHDLQTKKLGLDMLKLLSLHHEYIVLLVQDGYYLEAIRYARKNKVLDVRPSLFLDAAIAANDSQHVAALLRFLSEFIPGFRSTSDHERYSRFLNEMNSSALS